MLHRFQSIPHCKQVQQHHRLNLDCASIFLNEPFPSPRRLLRPHLHAQPIYREVRNLQWIQPVGEDRVQGMC